MGSFSHYLALTAHQAIGEKIKPLPILSPEHALGIPTFTRRYFEALFAKIDRPFILVFDNFERLSADQQPTASFARPLNRVLDGEHYGYEPTQSVVSPLEATRQLKPCRDQ